MPTSRSFRHVFFRPASASRSAGPVIAALGLLLAAASPALAADVPICAIQGRSATSPLVGQSVTTSGVVTRLNSNGYFIQDLTGDGDPATSDGVFVFTGSAPTVQPGQLVRLSGTVTEFNTGAASNADTAAHRITQLTATTLLSTANGYGIAPTPVTLPETVDDDLERYEGMLVTIAGPLTVSQNFFQARYGQLTLSAGGRLVTPTERHRPGTPEAAALADRNRRSRILLDDGSSAQNPNPTPFIAANGVPRAGDRVAAVTGVVDYGLATASSAGFGDYKIHPTVAPVFTVANPRSAMPPAVGGNVKLAAFNVLNYFTTFTDGRTAAGQTGQGCMLGTTTSAANCRGADNLAEFRRQQAKIVEAMAAIDADALGLMEIQNNGPVATQNLVDALDARLGNGSYAAVATPVNGAGTDAIKVAIIYKPARLRPIGSAVADTDPVNNRPTLAQTFAAANGERFTLVVNHLKSKSGCPGAGDADAAGNTDSGDGQGCWNALRVRQAERLRTFVAGLQSGSGSNDVLLVGDFNAYGREDPVYALTGSGYADLVARYEGDDAYSYVFDGAAGRLDHAIGSASLAGKVTGAREWHINADESVAQDYNLEFKAPLMCGGGACPADPSTPSPYRSSDHDPVVLGLDLFKAVFGSPARDRLVGSPGDDRISGGAGADTLTGGAGINVYVYESLRDAGDTITDFVPGKDRIDLRTLLASIGADASTAFSTGVVRLVASGADTLLLIDTDGRAGKGTARTLATLVNIAPADLVPGRDLGLS